MSTDTERQLRQLRKNPDSTVRARAGVLGESVSELEAQLTALMDAFNDQAAELERTRELEVAANGRYLEAEATINQLTKERDAENAQASELAHGYHEQAATIERLRAAIRGYVVAVSRAPNNRDEAEIDAASQGLVAAVTGKEQE